MTQWINKLNSVYHFAISLLLIGLGLTSGLYIAQIQTKKESNKLTVDTIAVVNMDEGVVINGSYINYATELIRYPDLNFISTSLEEARRGVSSGSYAAYILIPVEFSHCVISLNDVPDSALVEYSINPNLREDIYLQVRDDISAFTDCLTDNIEFMYLSSILAEFHNAQDAARQIMENDTQDMELLLAIRHEDLENHISLSPIEMPAYNIEALNLYPYYQDVYTLINDIFVLYTSYENTGKQTFNDTIQSTSGINTDFSDIRILMENANITKTASGSDLIADGIQIIDSYLNNILQTNTETQLHIREQLDRYQNSLEENVADLLQNGFTDTFSQSVNQYYSGQLSQMDHYIAELASITMQLSNMAATFSTAEQNDGFSGMYIDNYTMILDQLAQIQSGLNDLKNSSYEIDTVQISGLAAQIAGQATGDFRQILNDMDALQFPDTSEISAILTNQIQAPFQDNLNRIKNDFNSAFDRASASMTNYQQSILNFHIYDYVNEDEIHAIIENILTNMSNMQTAINTQDEDYRTFLFDTYQAVNQTLTTWQEEIQEADADSARILEEGLEAAKQSRTNSNSNNVTLLYAMTQKLPYTRLGSIENMNSYEFMVSPISSVDIGENRRLALFHFDRAYGTWLLWISCTLSLLTIGRIFYHSRQKNREESSPSFIQKSTMIHGN